MAHNVGKRTREALYVHSSVIMPASFTSYTGGVDPDDLDKWCSFAYRAWDICEEQRHIAKADRVGLRGASHLNDNWLLKFARNRVSFLYYPNFLVDAHPALSIAVTVDLDKRTVKVRSYATTTNPPILHRKEEFVAEDHPYRKRFAAATRWEETQGFYAKATLHLIGTREGWKKVCRGS